MHIALKPAGSSAVRCFTENPAKAEAPVSKSDIRTSCWAVRRGSRGHDDCKQGTQSTEGEAGAGRKWHEPHRRRAGVDVCARAEPAPPRPLQGGDPAAEAAEAHAEEPRLCSQLPRQARHAEGGAGEAEGRAPAGGGEAGLGERQHEGGAGRAALQVRGSADLRQDCGPRARGPHPGPHCLHRRAPHPWQGGRHQRHYHRQVQNGGAIVRPRGTF